MIKIVRFLYILYHGLFPSKIGVCRYNPTCSKYALEAMEKYGILKGSYKTVLRLFSCHPLSRRPLYDPI